MTITEFLLARIAEDEKDAEEFLMEFGGVWSPERVLDECEAKRRIVELHYSWNLQAERNPEPPFGPILKAQAVTAETIIRALASVYADHPDYDTAWSTT